MIDCDFIPPKYHEQRVTRRMVKRRSACVGGMFAVMVLWIAAHQHQLSVAEAMLTEVSSQKSQLAQIAQMKAELAAEQSRLIAHEQLIEQLSDRADLVIVSSELTRCMPESVVFDRSHIECFVHGAVRVERSGAVSSQSTSVESSPMPAAVMPAEPIRPTKLRMAGIAPTSSDVIQFAATLEKSNLFDKVYTEKVESTIWSDRKAEYFEMSCELIPHERTEP
ncbi:MAG: hypothetical protein IPK83_22080 [Planctomycetes bacterium]|nr:hypothetical protein [Planctomycetota bacterium]